VSRPFSLDPDLDRARFERLAREVASLAGDWIESESRDPVLQKVSAVELSGRIRSDVPWEGEGWPEVMASLASDVLPHLRRNGHPRFLAYVSSSAEPVGVLADFPAPRRSSGRSSHGSTQRWDSTAGTVFSWAAARRRISRPSSWPSPGPNEAGLAVTKWSCT
jgi:hypothetical protein